VRNGKGVAGHAAFLALLVFLSAASWAPAQQAAGTGQIKMTLDPGQSKVHWTLGSTLHTVHGTFNFKSGAMQFDSAGGSAAGEFVVYATSGESGNDSRDKKMHTEILESARYPEVVFRPTRVEGTVAVQGASNVQLHGIFVLHGAEHDLTVPVQAELSGNTWRGAAKFSVPYLQWGLKSPNTWLLKADPDVQIELELRGSLQRTAS